MAGVTTHYRDQTVRRGRIATAPHGKNWVVVGFSDWLLALIYGYTERNVSVTFLMAEGVCRNNSASDVLFGGDGNIPGAGNPVSAACLGFVKRLVGITNQVLATYTETGAIRR